MIANPSILTSFLFLVAFRIAVQVGMAKVEKLQVETTVSSKVDCLAQKDNRIGCSCCF